MIAIDVADLVVIAGDLYGIGPGAALDRLDIDAAQAALAEADLTEGPDASQPRRGRERGTRRGHRLAGRVRPDRPRAAPDPQVRLA